MTEAELHKREAAVTRKTEAGQFKLDSARCEELKQVLDAQARGHALALSQLQAQAQDHQ